MKHVVVTGGAKGIGKAIVEELAAGDFRITATYNSSSDVAASLGAEHPNVTYVQVNLQDREAVAFFVADMQAGDPIDVLINNAGVYMGKPFESMSNAEVLQQIDLNLTAPTLLMHGLLPTLKQSSAPLIINISSQAVHVGFTGEALYSAVKTALSSLSHTLRAELNPEGVRLVTIEPFAVNTYGIPELSNMIVPSELAKQVLHAIELPDHLQLDNVGISHIKQNRPDYPEWIER